MANTIISPNMNLPVPVPTVDPGPDYANNEVQCFNQIDSHNHTPGNGVPITPAGLNINSALNIQQQALQNVGQINFTSQASLTTPSTLYEEGSDLYFNDGVGNIIRITQSGSVTGAAGTITGLPSGTASASFQSVSGTFQFQSATNTPANITGASLTLAPQTTGTNNITISAPNPLASTYSITLPSATPAATNILQMGTDGTIYNALNVDNSTLTIAANVLKVANGGITSTQIGSAAISQSNLANNSVGTNQLINASVTPAKLASANIVQSSSSGVWTNPNAGNWNAVTNLSVTITTSGRPVMLIVQGGSGGGAFISWNMQISDGSYGIFSIWKNNSTLLTQQIFMFSNYQFFAVASDFGTTIPLNSFYLDTPTAGTWTYSIKAYLSLGNLGVYPETNFQFHYGQLVAQEL